MAINIITYSGKVRTAKHDAIVYDAALDRSGILNGCNVTSSGDTITVAVGYGIIKGRVFEVTQESFRVEFPGSGTRTGGLAITLDLGSQTPLTMGVIYSDTSDLELDIDNNVNFNNGRYQILVAKYTLTTSGITNLIQAAHLIPQDSVGYTNFNDYTEPGVYYINSGLGDYTNVPQPPTGSSAIVNGWLVVYDDRRNGTQSSAIKQIFFRHGSQPTHHHTYIRTRTGADWQAWVRIITDLDLYTFDHNLTLNTSSSTTTSETRFTMINKATNNVNRNCGLFISGANNFGLYDYANGEWILQSATNGDVTIPHKLIVNSFNPSSLTVGKSSDLEVRIATVTNHYRSMGLRVTDQQNAGLFDVANNEWVFRSGQNGNVEIAHPLTVTGALTVSNITGALTIGGKLTANKSFAIGSVTITPSAANEPKSANVTWSLGGVPKVMVTPETTVVGSQVKGVAVSDVTATGAKIWVTRSNTTATVVHYLAIYV